MYDKGGSVVLRHCNCIYTITEPAPTTTSQISLVSRQLLNLWHSLHSSSSSSSCSWRVTSVILFLNPQDEVGPSTSSLVVPCSFVLLVYIVMLVLVVYLCPSSVRVVATFSGIVLFPLLYSVALNQAILKCRLNNPKIRFDRYAYFDIWPFELKSFFRLLHIFFLWKSPLPRPNRNFN